MILSKVAWPLHSADVCIVGAGPVGLALAFELEKLGLTVLLLEAGPKGREGAVEAGAISFANAHHASPMAATHQGIGGTSALWGGRCVAYDDLDFVQRDHVPFSGWPLPHSEMSRFYQAASTFLLSGSAPYHPSLFTEEDVVMTDAVERWSRSPALGPFYQKKLQHSERIALLTNASVTDIVLDNDGQGVRALTIHHEGEARKIEAKRFVLAAGGIEIARLLLSLQKRYPAMLGGSDGPLGRYYQGHLTGYIAVIQLTDQRLQQQLSFQTNGEGYRTRRRLQLSPRMQLQEKLLNSVFWIDSISISDPAHGSGTLSMLYLVLAATGTYRRLSRGLAPRSGQARKGELSAHFANIVREGASLRKFFSSLGQVWRNKKGQALANPSGRYLLRYHAEQTPNPQSRVEIRENGAGDALSVDYRVTEEDVASVLRSHSLIDGWLREHGLGRLEYIHDEAERRKSVLAQAFDGYHQIGLARMSSKPEEGVVDAECRVHGLANLFLAGACVFPTGSHANPTLPAVALALRLGEHLAALKDS
jgi:choline dehydrogenase-like flavoprotein